MKFILTFAWAPDKATQEEGIGRFLAAGGMSPEGARLLGRWTRLDFSGGFVLLECDDPRPLTEMALQWSDLMSLELIPVIEDAELSEVLQRAGFRPTGGS
jgi:hypothetical protein